MSDDLHVDIVTPLKKMHQARKLHREGKMTDEEFERARAEFFASSGRAGEKAIQEQGNNKD